MKVAELLESRRSNWRELEDLCRKLSWKRKASIGPAAIARFAFLYRSTCADLALAEAYHLPPNTVQYLHELVGRAHNQLYRGQRFRFAEWWREFFVELPRRLFRDRTLRLAFVIFWGFFLAAGILSYFSSTFPETLLGREALQQMETMHSGETMRKGKLDTGSLMTGFYIMHNAGIGLQCFAAGLVFGVLGLFVTISNAAVLGAVFGYMASIENRRPFFEFVTAHGPFELTGIVMASAAGMRLGFALVDTRGLTRGASVRLAAREAVPAAGLATLLFCMAAPIEGLISGSAAPYPYKAGVAIMSTLILFLYFIVNGSRGAVEHAAR